MRYRAELRCYLCSRNAATLEWDAAKLKVTNVKEANMLVRKRYRKGWEVKGL